MKIGPIFKILDPRQCGDVIPVRNAIGSGIVIEHVCVLNKGHDGVHRDKFGAVWVNQAWLMRQRGL